MLKFEIEILFAEEPVSFQIEELDPWPDTNGYVRYAISGDDRKSVIAIDTSHWDRPVILTEEDAWDYYEKINYPEFEQVYCEDHAFIPEELEPIRQAIRKYIVNKS